MDEHGNALTRFVDAQAPVYETALAELEAGRKRTHWMWFVFPQIAGLGHSATAQFYAIRSRGEAEAYLSHPVLGPRLLACTDAVGRHGTRTAAQIFGSPDDLKFRSSMTLFGAVSDDPEPFRGALTLFCGGQPDGETLRLLSSSDR